MLLLLHPYDILNKALYLAFMRYKDYLLHVKLVNHSPDFVKLL